MSQEIELECFRLIEENDIDVNELPEKIQRKLEQLEDLIEDFNEAEDGSDEERECELRMEAMDSGLAEDLSQIVEKIRQQEQEEENNLRNAQQQKQMANGGQTNTNSNTTNADSPSWRFWM